MTDTFDAVLAEMRERANAYPAGVCMDLRVFANRLRDAHHAAIAHGKRANQAAREELDRLAAAHAAEVAKRDARIAELEADKKAMFIRAREWATRSGEQEQRAEAAERDAGRWQAMREHMVAVDWKPEMGGGPVVMFECMAERVMAGPEGADAIADAAVDFAAIATTEQAPERAGRE